MLCQTLFVSRISYETTEAQLKKDFEQYGPIKRLRLVYAAAAEPPHPPHPPYPPYPPTNHPTQLLTPSADRPHPGSHAACSHAAQ